MELIDVTGWEDDRWSCYGGYTRKCGKISPNGTRWMIKFEKRHSFKSVPLNLFEQHINSQILRMCGFDAQETFLGTCDDYLVLCCKNFVPLDSKLITMDVFLRTLYNSYELTEIVDINQFERVLQENEILQPYRNDLVTSFWNMVILDIFIGNLERTTSDFGYIVSKEGTVTPAPLYDNRSNCLACTIPIHKNGKPVLREDLLHFHKFKEFEDARSRILPVLECNMEPITSLIHEQECLSEAQKSWKFEQLCRSLKDLKSDL